MSMSRHYVSADNGTIALPVNGFGSATTSTAAAATTKNTNGGAANASQQQQGGSLKQRSSQSGLRNASTMDDANAPLLLSVNADVEQVGIDLPGDGSKLGGLVRGPTVGRGVFRRGALADLSQNADSRRLRFANGVLAVLYALAFIAAVVVVPLKAAHRQRLYVDPKLWDAGSSSWMVTPTLVDKIHLSWMYVALLGAFALFRAAHLVPFVRKLYDNLVLEYDYNSLRWVFHGAALGGIVAGSVLTCGASNLFVFMGTWVAFFSTCFQMLFMEETNPRSSGTKQSPRPEVNWLPFIGAAITATAVAVLATYYFAAAADDKASALPWFVYATYSMAGALCVAVVAVNAFYHFTGLIPRYVYLEYLNVLIEPAAVLCLVYFQLAGFATAGK